MRVFDAHVHVFPDHIAGRTVEAMGRLAGIVPAFDGTRAGLLASMEHAGITAALNCPVATKPEQVESINRWAAEQAWPVISLGTVHPDYADIPGALRAVAGAGLHGIKLHPEFQEFALDDARLGPVWRGCADLGLVVFLHCGGDIAFPPPYRSSPAGVRAVLDAYPPLRLVAAHFGSWRMWDAVERELIGRDVCLDLSYTLGDLADKRLVTLARRHGVDRVMFGTDAPWRDQAAELERFLLLPFTPELSSMSP